MLNVLLIFSQNKSFFSLWEKLNEFYFSKLDEYWYYFFGSFLVQVMKKKKISLNIVLKYIVPYLSSFNAYNIRVHCCPSDLQPQEKQGYNLIHLGYNLIHPGYNLINQGYMLIHQGYNLIPRYNMIHPGHNLIHLGYGMIHQGYNIIYQEYKSIYQGYFIIDLGYNKIHQSHKISLTRDKIFFTRDKIWLSIIDSLEFHPQSSKKTAYGSKFMFKGFSCKSLALK